MFHYLRFVYSTIFYRSSPETGAKFAFFFPRRSYFAYTRRLYLYGNTRSRYYREKT